MKIRTQVRAGIDFANHNEILSAKPAGNLAAALSNCPEAFLVVKSCVRAGQGPHNHNETVAR